VKSAIGSQYNKVDLRVAAVIVFVYKTRRIYSKVYQGKSNTLTGAMEFTQGHWQEILLNMEV
jgi:hypothetical protein